MHEPWPELPLAKWQPTYDTLRLWAQVVGKVRLVRTPLVNHWWNVPLYVTARGLSTSAIPHEGRSFQMEFDFINHRLLIQTSEGESRAIALRPMSVSDFYAQVIEALELLGTPVRIWTMPVEIPDPIPFEKDQALRPYDAGYANSFWRILAILEPLFTEFRAAFQGKCSPVHFFWGGMDLAVTRFSGRPAPKHGPTPFTAESIVQEAYSHEVSSCGFWPGNEAVPEPAFYAYAYPEPGGFREYQVEPREAYYHPEMGEFILPYEVVARSAHQRETLMRFLQTTYAAAADLGGWDRTILEREPGKVHIVRY